MTAPVISPHKETSAVSFNFFKISDEISIGCLYPWVVLI